MSGVVIDEFRPVLKNGLRGFCRMRLPSGLVVHDVGLHALTGRACVSPPARPMTTKTGTITLDDNGKTRWQPLIRFVNKSFRDRSSEQVIWAVREAYPDALARAPT